MNQETREESSNESNTGGGIRPQDRPALQEPQGTSEREEFLMAIIARDYTRSV